MAPQMIHGIKFWTGGGQPPQFEVQIPCELAALFGPLGRDLVQKEHDVPAPPGAAQITQDSLKGTLVIRFGKVLPIGARLNIENPRQYPSVVMLAQTRDLSLFTDGHPHRM